MESTYRYSDIGVIPSSAATDFIETPSRPSRSATTTPAAPISWMVRPGFGPRRPTGGPVPEQLEVPRERGVDGGHGNSIRKLLA